MRTSENSVGANGGAVKVRSKGPEIWVNAEAAEALRHVAEAWSDGTDVRFEFMNTREVAPLVRLFAKECRSSVEYYDTKRGQTTRYRWTLPIVKYKRFYLAWLKHEGDLARPLEMRLGDA